MDILFKVFVSLFFVSACGAMLELRIPQINIPELGIECLENTEQKFSTDEVFLYNWCERKDGVKDGKRKVYYLDGQLYIDSKFCNGKLCGSWRTYHENGAIKSKGQHKDGKPNGAWITYYKNGNMFSSGKFRDGCKDGVWYFYDENEKKIVKILANAKTCRSEAVKKYNRRGE